MEAQIIPDTHNAVVNLDTNLQSVNKTVYLNDMIVDRPLTNTITLHDLEPNTGYELTIHLTDTDEVYVYPFMTDSLPYHLMGIYELLTAFGMLLVIGILIYMGRSLPIYSYVAVLISLMGIVYVLQYETEFFLILAYAIAFIASVYNVAIGEIK